MNKTANTAKEELKKKFDGAVCELVHQGTDQFGEVNFYTQAYVKMFGTYPNIFTFQCDGYYLNPEAEDYVVYDDEEEEDEYREEEEKDIYTFDNISIQKTFINLVEKYKDEAYIIRRDEYPAIIADNKIIFWSDYMHLIYILQDSQYLEDDIKAQVVDKKNDKDNRWFTYVTTTNQGFSDTAMRVKKQDIDISMNYNDDLPHEAIVDFLKGTQSGLILLHGLPGTGKTTYIRHLMHEIKGRRFIVLDSNVFAYITDSSFINLLLENKNSVIILEDCDTILGDRLTTNNHLLSTLLNISDGILGDSFNFKFICTFNANTTDIDEAALRKGRMKLRYEFKELTADKTYALGQKLGRDIPKGQSLVLTEIYNYGTENGGNYKKSKKIGFGK